MYTLYFIVHVDGRPNKIKSNHKFAISNGVRQGQRLYMGKMGQLASSYDVS